MTATRIEQGLGILVVQVQPRTSNHRPFAEQGLFASVVSPSPEHIARGLHNAVLHNESKESSYADRHS
jgi:hypothetical protein